MISSPGPIWEKYIEWPQTNSDMFKVKSTHRHTIYRTPPMPIFSSVSFYAKLGLIAQFWESVGKTSIWPDVLKVKSNHMHTTYTRYLKHPNFRLVCSMKSRFWIMTQAWEKCTTPKWPGHVEGQKYPFAHCIHPWGPNFHQFRPNSLCNELFWDTAQFWE